MSTSATRNGFAQRLERFWFRPVSAAGFGMMRVAFGIVACAELALQWKNVARYYSDSGLMPHSAVSMLLRPDFRFSLLDWVQSPSDVSWLYVLLLCSLLLVAAGLWTRAALAISTVLLYSFHEYNPVMLDGGDTVLRLLALILLVSPCDKAFTLPNALRRLRRVVQTGSDQPAHERTMPIWPYRLLLWQMSWIYISSVLEKISGSTWMGGSATAIAMHHGMFSRLPLWLADGLTSLSPTITYFVLLAQAAWVFLLLLPALPGRLRLSARIYGSIKRAILVAGVLMHGGIMLTMDVGLFSLVMFTAYLGLLVDDDFRAIRALLNRKHTQLVVLFDGSCGLCRRSVTMVRMFDWLHRVHVVDFHDASVRKRWAPDTPLASLERAMHVRLPSGTFDTGFRGFRTLATQLPLLWPLVPLLFLPGMAVPGERMYNAVASRRMRCSNGVCRL